MMPPLSRLVVGGLSVLGVAALVAGLFVSSGLVPIRASSGHWAITEWILSFAMRRAVATQSMGVDVPALEAQELVLKGAGAYETACRSCHGTPAAGYPRIAHGMTPRPPYLPDTIAEWDPAELFYIVKHGVKFTGMPAWPSLDRDDEIWAMVAFLRALPSLDGAAYQRLAFGEITDVAGDREVAGAWPGLSGLVGHCARCHGRSGLGRVPGTIPKLAGQSDEYLEATLEAFARVERHSGIMGPVAAPLTGDEMRHLSRYYASLETVPDVRSTGSAPSAAVERGRLIATRGIPERRVPACADCHGPTVFPRNPRYPNLAGQHADYLRLQLRLFAGQARGGSAYADLMRPVARGLSDGHMYDVAAYYASLGNGPLLRAASASSPD